MPVTMDDHLEQIKQRAKFLLREAGDCRACEIAELIGIPTGDATRVLVSLESEGVVARYSITPAIEKWTLKRTV